MATGGLLAGGVSLPTAKIGGTVKALANSNVTDGDSLQVLATADRDATATAQAFALGLRTQRQDSLAEITSTAATEATIGSGATVDIDGFVTVHALANNSAYAEAKAITIGIVVSVTTVEPVANTYGSTSANINGSIGTTVAGVGPDGVAGTIGVAGATNIDVLASAVDRAHSVVKSTTVGIISVDPSNADARTEPTVSAQFGSGNITGSGFVSLVAESLTDTDSDTDSSGGGLVNVQILTSRVFANPTVSATVLGGLVQAGGQLRIEARHGQQAPDYSDGTIDSYNLNVESITFDKDHGLVQGDIITYQLGNGQSANGETAIGGLTDGESYSVILTGDSKTIRLGVQFVSSVGDNPFEASIDTVLGTLNFAFSYSLHDGDIVTYEIDGPNAIPGLTPGTKYRVIRVDDLRIKLQGLSMGQTGTFNGSNVDSGADTIHLPGLSTDDAVTYVAPPAPSFLDSAVDINLVTQGSDEVMQTTAGGVIVHADTNIIYLTTGDGDAVQGHGLPDGVFVQYTTTGRRPLLQRRQHVRLHRLPGRSPDQRWLLPHRQGERLRGPPRGSPRQHHRLIDDGQGASGTHTLTRASYKGIGLTTAARTTCRTRAAATSACGRSRPVKRPDKGVALRDNDVPRTRDSRRPRPAVLATRLDHDRRIAPVPRGGRALQRGADGHDTPSRGRPDGERRRPVLRRGRPVGLHGSIRRRRFHSELVRFRHRRCQRPHGDVDGVQHRQRHDNRGWHTPCERRHHRGRRHRCTQRNLGDGGWRLHRRR